MGSPKKIPLSKEVGQDWEAHREKGEVSPKLSSDELDRMLCSDTTVTEAEDCSDTTEAVSMDTGVEHEDVSATNILDETNRSATTNERSDTTVEECSATTNERSATTNECSATTSEATETCSATTSKAQETCSATTSECSDTTKTESQRVNQWKKENRDTLRIDLPKGMKAEIQAEAKKRGCSVTTLIQRALASYCSDTTDQ